MISKETYPSPTFFFPAFAHTRIPLTQDFRFPHNSQTSPWCWQQIPWGRWSLGRGSRVSWMPRFLLEHAGRIRAPVFIWTKLCTPSDLSVVGAKAYRYQELFLADQHLHLSEDLSTSVWVYICNGLTYCLCWFWNNFFSEIAHIYWHCLEFAMCEMKTVTWRNWLHILQNWVYFNAFQKKTTFLMLVVSTIYILLYLRILQLHVKYL